MQTHLKVYLLRGVYLLAWFYLFSLWKYNNRELLRLRLITNRSPLSLSLLYVYIWSNFHHPMFYLHNRVLHT